MTDFIPTDWRALCDELLEIAEMYSDGGPDYAPFERVLARARALLTQPEPQGPTVMEIIELHTWMEDEWRTNNDGDDLPMVDFARAVLARWGTPTIQGGWRRSCCRD